GRRVKRPRKPRPKSGSEVAARRVPVNGPAVAASATIGDTDPLADARIRPLLERYCGLAGVKQVALGPDHSKLSLPQAERPFFRDRASLRVAFPLDALEPAPDGEIVVPGTPVRARVLDAS